MYKISKRKCSSFLKRLLIIVLVFMLLMSCFVSFASAANEEEYGFIEYQTNASINFNEIIEVVFTDKNTGYFYTHHLYRVNNYVGNMKMPFGTYSIEAKVVLDSEDNTLVYEVDYPKDDIVIKNSNLAVPIVLTVNISSQIDVSGPLHTSEILVSESAPGESVLETSPDATISETEYETTVSDNDISESVDETNAPDENELREKDNEKEKNNSLLFSTLFYIGILLAILIVYWVVKRRGYSR